MALKIIKNLFRSVVVRLFGMSDRPIEIPDSLGMSVTAWMDNLLAHSTSSQHGLDRVSKLKVLSISGYKEKGAFSHELLVAMVKTPEGRFNLLLDRSAMDQQTITKDSPSASSITLSTNLNVASQTSSSIGEAKDFVRLITETPAADAIFTLEFETCDVSLFDLAVVASAVHKAGVTYRLLDSQCYWFVDTISAVLERRYKAKRNDNGKDAGKYLAVTIQSRKSDRVENVIKIYDDLKKDIDQKVLQMMASTTILTCLQIQAAHDGVGAEMRARVEAETRAENVIKIYDDLKKDIDQKVLQMMAPPQY